MTTDEPAADERPLPQTVAEWVKDRRGPIPPATPEVVDWGLMTPREVLRMLARQIRERRLVLYEDDEDGRGKQ